MPRSLLPSPAADARDALPDAETPAFDRLATSVLARSSAPLGPLLRALLPGTAGIRWLCQEQLSPTTRAAALTAGQWSSLYRCWASTAATPHGGGGNSSGGRPSPHGHAPAARAAPRWH